MAAALSAGNHGIGALAPLSLPGWHEAGEQLVAGMRLAAGDINRRGGVGGSAIELLVRDTGGGPDDAAKAVHALADLGVDAVVGEYHSVSARAAASAAAMRGLAYLCSSAVIDDLATDGASGIARLPPPQSVGWRHFAAYLIASGHSRWMLARGPGPYWHAGSAILKDEVTAQGGEANVVDANALSPCAVADAVAANKCSVLLLVCGYPEPSIALVRALRDDPRLASLVIAAPAGQPEFATWERALGREGAAIPFLRYRPRILPPSGQRVEVRLQRYLGAAPSFVALEGYDAIVAMARAIEVAADTGASVGEVWPIVSFEGTRGSVSFARPAGTGPWQAVGMPVQIAERDRDKPQRIRILAQL